MDEVNDSAFSLPPWIFIAVGLVALGAIIMLAIKYRQDDGTSNPFFPRRRRRRHRHRQDHRHDRHGNEYK